MARVAFERREAGLLAPLPLATNEPGLTIESLMSDLSTCHSDDADQPFALAELSDVVQHFSKLRRHAQSLSGILA